MTDRLKEPANGPAPSHVAGPVTAPPAGRGRSLAANVLHLQRTIGNSLVAALLAGPSSPKRDEPPLAIQRRISVTYMQLCIPPADRQQTGSRKYEQLKDVVRSYHSSASLNANGAALAGDLRKIVELSEAYLALNDGKATGEIALVTQLRDEARADLGLAPIVAAAPQQAQAPQQPVVAGPAPTELIPRLLWMKRKMHEAGATPEQQQAGPTIDLALKEARLIQKIQVEGENYRGQKWPETEDSALSELLAELFPTFGLVALGFRTGAGGRNPPPTQAAFGAKVLSLLGGLTVGGESDFSDSEVILSGSAVTGKSFAAKGPGGTQRAFGRHSDFDVGVVNERLFNAVKGQGREIRGGTRTEPDPVQEIADVSYELQRLARRDVSIMVYKDRAAAQRAPGIRIA